MQMLKVRPTLAMHKLSRSAILTTLSRILNLQETFYEASLKKSNGRNKARHYRQERVFVLHTMYLHPNANAILEAMTISLTEGKGPE